MSIEPHIQNSLSSVIAVCIYTNTWMRSGCDVGAIGRTVAV